VRTKIDYRAAKENQIVHQVVYEWLKTTKSSKKFDLLRDWRDQKILLLIDLKNLKVKPKNPERYYFLQKYVGKYLGVDK
jgi:hypothetical protein